MKKKVLIWTLVVLLVVTGFYYIYELVNLNQVKSEDVSIKKKIEDTDEHIGVFDKTLYSVNKNRLLASDSMGQEVFVKNLGLNFVDIIYDKYIYVAQNDGLIRALDRENGDEIRKIDLNKKLYDIELVDGKLIAYSDKSINKLSLYLKNELEKKFEHRPVKYREQKEKSAVIFLDRELGGMKSRFAIYNKDEEIYYISSVDELFMHEAFLSDGSSLVLTNSYLYKIKDSKVVKKTFLMNPRSIDIQKGKIALIDFEKLKIYDDNLELTKEVKLGFKANKLSIYENSILIAGENTVASFENDNLIKTDVQAMKGTYVDKFGMYAIFGDRVEKVKAY